LQELSKTPDSPWKNFSIQSRREDERKKWERGYGFGKNISLIDEDM